jgi:3-oxoacyl-[acyl-carrier protein] reductase
MLLDLKDKGVTGSARRVGKAIAVEFAKQGSNVVIHHSSSDKEAQETASEIKTLGVDAIIIRANQANPDEVAEMFKEIQNHFGRLDVFVNSAAIFKKTPLLEIGFTEWQEVIGTNLTGPFFCTQQAAKLMIAGKRGGAIINISDNSGLNPWVERPHHSVSKAGVIMLTQVSALALAKHNIRVNCVVPGPVLRPAGEPGAMLDAIAAGLPLERIGAPSDIARACVFLATNDFVTGSTLRVDGGEGLARTVT